MKHLLLMAISFFFLQSHGAELPPMAPALLKKEDITSPSKKTIADQVLDSYFFVGDFEPREHPEYPRNWPYDKLSTEKSLLLGKPIVIPRIKDEISSPLFLLTSLPHVRGNDALTTLLNTAVSHWGNGRIKEAIEAFDQLEFRLAAVPRATPIQITMRLLRAYLDLQLSTMPVAEIEQIIGQKSAVADPKDKSAKVPPTLQKILYFTAKQGFTIALSKIELDKLFATSDKSFSKSLYESMFNDYRFFEQGTVAHEAPVKVELANYSLDPLVLVRSLAIHGLWNIAMTQRTSPVADSSLKTLSRLKSVIAKLDKQIGSKAKEAVFLDEKKEKTVRQKLRIIPQNHHDMVSELYVFQAMSMMRAPDFPGMFGALNKAIEAAKSAKLRAAAFQIAGHIYFDFNNFDLARKNYAWAEAVSPEFIEEMPGSLFWGAEAAFWDGQYELSQKAFKKFTEVTGEKEFGPWARLRAAESTHALGDELTALEGYEYIKGTYPNHAATKETKVRVYCRDVKMMGPVALAKAAGDIQEIVANTRDDVRSQARACLLEAQLSALEKSKNKNAMEQHKLITTFEKDFPDSRYISIFAERKKNLKYAPLIETARVASNCIDVISTYEKNKNQIKKLNNKFAKELAWGDKENQNVLRCAALNENLKVWKPLQKIEKNKVQDALTVFASKKTAANAFKIYKSLPHFEKMKLIKVNESHLSSKTFWEQLAFERFSRFKIEGKERKKLTELLGQDVLRTPEKILVAEVFCEWALATKISSKSWDKITTIEKEWSALISEEDNVTCKNKLAKKLLSVSITSPSRLRDDRILLPYLEERGVEEASEEWLAYAQRLSRDKGSQNETVKEIFVKLNKQAGDEAVRKAAQVWLDKNGPS